MEEEEKESKEREKKDDDEDDRDLRPAEGPKGESCLHGDKVVWFFLRCKEITRVRMVGWPDPIPACLQGIFRQELGFGCMLGGAKKDEVTLPVFDIRKELEERLRESGRVLLRAPTGSGKSTGVPVILLEGELASQILGPPRILPGHHHHTSSQLVSL